MSHADFFMFHPNALNYTFPHIIYQKLDRCEEGRSTAAKPLINTESEIKNILDKAFSVIYKEKSLGETGSGDIPWEALFKKLKEGA
jgi:hypothetical protein